MGLQNTVRDKVTMRITKVKSSGQGEKQCASLSGEKAVSCSY